MKIKNKSRSPHSRVIGPWYTRSVPRRRHRAEGPGAPIDHSTHPTVVEYAAQEMMKGKSPKAAAAFTVKKLSGFTNMFIAPRGEVVSIQADALTNALWMRLVTLVIKFVQKIKPGFEHFALDGILQEFHQSPKLRPELKKRVIAELGSDVFTSDNK